jgi:transposase
VVSVEQWAEIRRRYRVAGLSIRVAGLSIWEIGRRTGLHRQTVRRALAAAQPPRYSPRVAAGSKLDPFKERICEQPQVDPGDP